MLWQGEAALLDVVEEVVLALHVVEDDEVGLITILKQVDDQPDNVAMLAHLEDLNLASLLGFILFAFLHCLNRGLNTTSDFVRGQLDHAELAFAQSLAQLPAEVEQVGLPMALRSISIQLLSACPPRCRSRGCAICLAEEHDLDWKESAMRLGAPPLLCNVLHEKVRQLDKASIDFC